MRGAEGEGLLEGFDGVGEYLESIPFLRNRRVSKKKERKEGEGKKEAKEKEEKGKKEKYERCLPSNSKYILL